MHGTRLGYRNGTRIKREPERNVYANGGEHLDERLILTKMSTFVYTAWRIYGRYVRF